MTALVKYDEACRAIAAAKSLDDVRALHDKAEALRAYGRVAQNRSLEVDAAEIRIRAERRYGEMLAEMKESGKISAGGRPPKKPVPGEEPVSGLTLGDLNTTKRFSSKCQKLAAVPEHQFEGMLGEWRDRVGRENERVTTNLLKAGDRARQNEELDNQARPLPKGKYSVIYADPPWQFQVWSGEGKDRAAENHYPTMTQQEIEALPVSNLAADDCALFMWAVMPQLPEALSVIEAWGFEYKTCAFTWVKTVKDGSRPATGMGYWTRANAEVCLLATRGSPKRVNADVSQVIVSPRMEHSRKPDEAIERIERLIDGPYIELFSRRKREGWSAWGNQA